MGIVIGRRELRPAAPQAAPVRLAPALERLACAMKPVEPPLADE